MAMAKIIEHILQRRSIRKFTAQKVELEIIDCLLQAAMAAPSASNARPWEFIIISDESRLKEMEACLPFGRMGAPLMIIVLGNPSIAANRSSEKFWMQDCCAATENILLAAAGLGLAGCIPHIHPGQAGQHCCKSSRGCDTPVRYKFRLPGRGKAAPYPV
jgi:nitroreductase